MVDPVTRRYLSGRLRLLPTLVGAGQIDLRRYRLQPEPPGQQDLPGDFATCAADQRLPHAVGAPTGLKLLLHGQEHLVRRAPDADRGGYKSTLR